MLILLLSRDIITSSARATDDLSGAKWGHMAHKVKALGSKIYLCSALLILLIIQVVAVNAVFVCVGLGS
jgi:hypothetical protein